MTTATSSAAHSKKKGGFRSGTSYCLTLDPYADQYVSRIFGARNYMVLDQVARLPEKLSMLYLGLTR